MVSCEICGEDIRKVYKCSECSSILCNDCVVIGDAILCKYCANEGIDEKIYLIPHYSNPIS